MRRIVIFIALGLLLAAGVWWWRHPSHPAPVNASLYETDMVAGLVRGLLAEMKPTTASVCFLAFGDGTTAPSREFIARFAGSRLAVRSCSSAAMPSVGQQFEISTGQPGLIIHIVQFKEIIPTTYDVLVSFSNLPNGQNRFTYRVSNHGGEWKITSRKAA